MTLQRLSLISLVLFICVIISISFFWNKFLDTPLTVAKPTVIYIPPGSSIEKVAINLQYGGFTRYPMLVILLARLRGYEHHLKAGEYELTPGMTPNQLLVKVVNGKVYLRRYTLVEGWTLKQVFTTINNNHYLKHTINQLSALGLAKKMGTQQINFEGFLNPDTYLFAAGVSDIVILKKAYWKMAHNLERLWLARDPNLPFTDPYQALIAASLIEKETARPEERAKIAGVIIRRLEKKMRLQIDAAVIYGLGANYTGKLTRENLKTDTPYNTYLRGGLPPTPIAMPSLASLTAALHPVAGTELYYVARGDGSHVFSNTLEDHRQAVKRYRASQLELLDFDKTGDEITSIGIPQDNSDASDHPLYPKSSWEDRFITQTQAIKVNETESPKPVTPKAKARLKAKPKHKKTAQKKSQAKVVVKHETKKRKGTVHHH